MSGLPTAVRGQLPLTRLIPLRYDGQRCTLPAHLHELYGAGVDSPGCLIRGQPSLHPCDRQSHPPSCRKAVHSATDAGQNKRDRCRAHLSVFIRAGRGWPAPLQADDEEQSRWHGGQRITAARLDERWSTLLPLRPGKRGAGQIFARCPLYLCPSPPWRQPHASHPGRILCFENFAGRAVVRLQLIAVHGASPAIPRKSWSKISNMRKRSVTVSLIIMP